MASTEKPFYKKKWFPILSIVLCFLLANMFYSIANGHGPIPDFSIIEDVDKTEDGTYIMTDTSYRSMIDWTGAGITPNRILEVDADNNVIWTMYGFAGLHEIEQVPNGNLLIADTHNDRVVEVNYPDKTTGWEWKPEEINWTKVNPAWGPDHYYNNPKTYDWSHLNDVDFYSYTNWNACLISIRNFDLVVEVNFSAEMENPNQAENIVWYYGDYKNYDLIRHQHNPDYLPNGNIIICDSENQRVVEVNRTTKQIVWEYNKIRGWCRDADQLPNGNILISESYSVYIINKTTQEKVWEFAKGTFASYDADLLSNGNILIGASQAGKAYEVDPDTNEVVWEYGTTEVMGYVFINCIIVIVLVLIGFGYLYRKDGKFDVKTHKVAVTTGIILIIIPVLIMINFWSVANKVIIFLAITLNFA